MGSKNPWNRGHLRKKRSFPQKIELLEISYFQDCATYTNIPSKCCEHPGWDIYGILTGYNPLFCFTFTLSEMFHQLQPPHLKLWDMLRRLETHTGAHYARTPKNYQNPYFWTGFYGFPRLKKRGLYGLAKVELCPKRVEKRSFPIALRDSTGFLQVSTGFLRVPENTAIWAPWTRWKL